MVEPAEPIDRDVEGASIETEWFSTWQTNDPVHDNKWATEIIKISRKQDSNYFTFESSRNSLEYEWEGIGEVHRNYYISGTWESKNGNPSAGSFMLHAADSQSRMRTGFLLGPTEGDRKNFGAWVLVRKNDAVPDLTAAHKHLEAAKQVLATSMCPGLGDLVKYSGGKFIEEFLHPEIKTALQLVNRGDPKVGVQTAFVGLEQYVSNASGITITNLPLLHLMENAFAPGAGPLCDGPFPPGDKRESSKQSRMRDLFTGSVYLRNIYGHTPPTTSVSDAVVLLMVATYFYRLVDAQATKRGRSRPDLAE